MVSSPGISCRTCPSSTKSAVPLFWISRAMIGCIGSRVGVRTTRSPGLSGLKSMVVPNTHALIRVWPSAKGAVKVICRGTSACVKVSRIEASRSSAGTSRVSSNRANGLSLFEVAEILFCGHFRRL